MLTVSGTNGALARGREGAGQQRRRRHLGGCDAGTGTSWSYADPATHATSFSYQARVVDAAGNVGTTDSQAVTIDTAAAGGDGRHHGDCRRHRHVIERLHHQRHHADGVWHQRRACRRREGAGQQRRRRHLGGCDAGTGTSWSYADPANPHATSFSYQARVVDTAGNVGTTDSQAVTIDTARRRRRSTSRRLPTTPARHRATSSPATPC